MPGGPRPGGGIVYIAGTPTCKAKRERFNYAIETKTLRSVALNHSTMLEIVLLLIGQI